MTTYNGRKMRRRRTRAELWQHWQAPVLAALVILGCTLAWYIAVVLLGV